MFGSNPRPTTTPAPALSAVPSSASNGTHRSFDNAANRLSSDVLIKGDIRFGGDLVIDGQVEGDISSDGTLTIGEHGKVTGEIEVRSISIGGLVKGNVRASERCALEAGGTLEGDVEAPRLAVDENATFIGSATITSKKR